MTAVGALLLWVAWSVLDAGRVLNRSGYSSMTRESHPILFGLEVASFAIFGFAAIAFGLAGVLGHSRLVKQMNAVAQRLPIVKLKVFVICALLVMLLACFGWVVVEELTRTSKHRAGS